MKEPEFILEPLPIAQLRLDARYQRELRESSVAEIVGNFHPEQFLPITVGMRADSSLHIVDGQHRVAAARRMGWAQVPCMVFESDGFEHEALVFERLQTNRAPLTVGQRWKARVARGEPKATAITEIVSTLGLVLSDRTISATSFCAYIACENAYERGNLKESLVLIIQAWEYDPTGFRANFVNAVSQFLSAMTAENFEVDMKRLVDAMTKVRPAQFLRESALAVNPNAVFMKRLLESYNKGLRSGKIEVDDPVALLRSVKAKRGNETRMAAGETTVAERVALKTPEERSDITRRGNLTRAENRRGGAGA